LNGLIAVLDEVEVSQFIRSHMIVAYWDWVAAGWQIPAPYCRTGFVFIDADL